MINKWIGIGNLTKDPDIRYTPSGAAVANFTVACNEKWKDKNSGEMVERTEFVNCVAWSRLAEIIGEYCQKGRQVYIEGRLQTRKWEKDGITRYSTEVVASEMKMLGSKGEQSHSTKSAPEYSGPPVDDDSIPF